MVEVDLICFNCWSRGSAVDFALRVGIIYLFISYGCVGCSMIITGSRGKSYFYYCSLNSRCLLEQFGDGGPRKQIEPKLCKSS